MHLGVLQLEEDFRKDINFVALNIDNTKWTSEVQQYRVRGVPHFVFLDGQAKQKTAAVGRVPQQVTVILSGLQLLARLHIAPAHDYAQHLSVTMHSVSHVSVAH